MNERILVVDDEPGMLRSLERILSPRYRVATASDSRAALALVEQAEPDLVLLDIRLPDTDGFELLGELRQRRSDFDVIFMTGVIHERDNQMIRSIRERAFYFIPKPFDREVLLTLVDRCLETRRITLANRQHTSRLEAELEDARGLQRSLLPRPAGELAGVSIAARYLPCTEVGGDLFDYRAVGDGSVLLLIADVCGHGASAAMLTAVVKAAFHDVSHGSDDALGTVRRIGTGIRSFDDSRFITAICIRIAAPSGALEYVNAGHSCGVVRDAEGELVRLDPTGPLISPAFPSATWEQKTIAVPDGASVLLYTDGVPESPGEAGFFGEDRLLRMVAGSSRSGAELLDEILSAVKEHSRGRPAADDLTLLTATIGRGSNPSRSRRA